MTAERKLRDATGRITALELQWSRGSVTAERRADRLHQLARALDASMEPRFGDRGTAKKANSLLLRTDDRFNGAAVR